jgi:hypothetical protein
MTTPTHSHKPWTDKGGHVKHKRQIIRPRHQQHPPTNALLLQIEKQLNGRKLTGKDWAHGERDGGPPQPATPRQGWPRAHATGSREGKGSWWRPA